MASDLPALLRAESLAEQAYRAIREGIATGLFSAGERVTERGLATRLNVSATPVREALRRLEQEGLIERVSARQLRVVDHSSGTLRELLLAGEFDMEIERAAGNPTLRSMIFSLSIIGQERRARYAESMWRHPEVGKRRVQGHRDMLAAFRSRDPDLVEQVFRRHATEGVELLLGDLD